jgi:hypothetical protein
MYGIMGRERIDFIGIGVGRSGTTWLATCLDEHPQILMSMRKSAKELRYFDFQPRFELGEKWYFDQFPPPQFGKIRGEFSPFYYVNRKSAERIAGLLPNVKILVVLRNPAEVVNSYFWYHRGAPWERCDASTLDEMLNSSCAAELLNLGYYFEHLKRFFDVFPREQIHVAIYDDLLKDPSRAVRDVFRFLDVGADVIPESLHFRVNEMSTLLDGSLSRFARWGSIGVMGVLRKAIVASPMLETRLHRLYRQIFSDRWRSFPERHCFDRRRLDQIYRGDLIQLQDLIRRDLSMWWHEVDGTDELPGSSRSSC